MCSTRETYEAAVAAFYDDVLVPLGTELQKGEREPTAFGDECRRSSWSPAPTFDRKSFQPLLGFDAESLKRALQHQWKDEPKLQPLADRLAELAALMTDDVQEEQDVSPFVYVMF